MTLPRLAALQNGWELIPPISDTMVAVAVWLGAIKPPGRKPEGSLQQLLDEFGAVDGMKMERRKSHGE